MANTAVLRATNAVQPAGPASKKVKLFYLLPQHNTWQTGKLSGTWCESCLQDREGLVYTSECSKMMWSTPRLHSRASSVQHLHDPSNKIFYRNSITRLLRSHTGNEWIWQNVLLLNEEKTEISVFWIKRRTIKSQCSMLQLLMLKFTNQGRNLGVVIDSDLNFKIHIKTITKSAHCHLKNRFIFIIIV